MSEESFRKVLKTLRNNKVMVSVEKDGIYTRLAGNENDGEAFSKIFVNSYPFENYQSKDQQIKDLEEIVDNLSKVIKMSAPNMEGCNDALVKSLQLKQFYQQKYPTTQP